MPIKKDDYGYQFTIDICEAISLYTNKACKVDSKGFIYRGSDLKYAVERCLFIQCVNSKKLYQKYVLKKLSNKKAKFIILSKYEKDIYNLIFHKDNFKFNILFKKFYSITKKIIHLYRIYKLSFRKKNSFFKENKKIVFNISNIKFLNYAMPLIKYLEKDSFCFQLGSDVDLAKLIENRGFRALEIPNYYNFINHITVSKFLADFLDLLNIFDNNFYSLKNKNIKSIVTFEGNAPQDIVILEVAKKINIPCYCIQQGWSPYVHSGFRNMSFTEYFIWGNEFKKQLIRFNPKQIFTITGSTYLKPSVSISKISKIKTISFFLQPICLFMNKFSFENFLKLIISCSENFPDIKIIVKEHPSSKLNNFFKDKLIKNKNITLYESNYWNLNKILESSDITLSVFSSVILESINKNKLPIICSFGAIPKYFPFLVDSKCAIEIFNIKDAMEIIDYLIKNPKEVEIYQKNILKIKQNLFDQNNACRFISSRIS